MFPIKSLPGLSAAALLGLMVASCGSSNPAHSVNAPTPSTTSSTSVAATSDSQDGDGADPGDDSVVLEYGHTADAQDTRAIKALVESYYAAAASGESTTVCTLLIPRVADNAAEEFGQRAHPESCPSAVATVLARNHRTLTRDSGSLVVTGVRIEGDMALALLRVATTPEPRKISLRQVGATWRLRELLDTGMP